MFDTLKQKFHAHSEVVKGHKASVYAPHRVGLGISNSSYSANKGTTILPTA